MVIAPAPANEAERLAAVEACHVLDSPPEPTFDGIALLASQLCGTPISLVTVVDASRQWFKARVGLPSVSETSRDVAFCAHTILAREPLVVEDAAADARFADNPLVTGEPHVRFYAGIPLVLDDGSAVGSLCVIDHVPRHLSAPQISALSALARQVSNELSLRRKLASSRPPPPSPHEESDTLAERPTLQQAPLRHATMGRDPRLPVATGQLVEGRYRVQAILGEGGMGVVARALDTHGGESVALKFMRAEALGRKEAVERFVREARALRRMHSPHVARMLDVGNLPSGEPFIVMELLEGEDLSVRLAREGHLTVREGLHIARQLCDALACAHAHGILHRDLKPANLFLVGPRGEGETLKVLDFGISKLLEQEGPPSVLTSEASMVGSPHYMSPEQMASPTRADARSDLWAVGVVLFEMLAGASPFEADSLPALCTQVLIATPPPLHELCPEASVALSEVVARCLQKDPGLRYQSAAELSAALASLPDA